ncbi:MAG: cell wall hydrolase [Hungateiclostridium saccincola]|nr:cell wall hydrolase [Acetivibrio saccincola]
MPILERRIQMNVKRVFLLLIIIVLCLMQTIAAHGSSSYTNLKFGSRGTKVVRLQQALQNKGYYKSSVDGIYGKITERAVINFQLDNKIRIDGIAGKQTKSLLYSSAYSDAVYWLSRIIHAEAQSEPYEGKVAVGNVVLNRVKSPGFPNTIYGVIFEYYKGIPQFTPVANGTIYNTPSKSSIQAAKDSLNGARPVGDSLYFFNPSKSAGTWIVKNRQYYKRIGNHVFYR